MYLPTEAPDWCWEKSWTSPLTQDTAFGSLAFSTFSNFRGPDSGIKDCHPCFREVLYHQFQSVGQGSGLDYLEDPGRRRDGLAVTPPPGSGL